MVAVFPGRKVFWGHEKCGCWGFQVKCASMYWELTLRSGNSLGEEGTEWVHRREEGRVLHQDLLGPLGMGTESEERPQ